MKESIITERVVFSDSRINGLYLHGHGLQSNCRANSCCRSMSMIHVGSPPVSQRNMSNRCWISIRGTPALRKNVKNLQSCDVGRRRTLDRNVSFWWFWHVDEDKLHIFTGTEHCAGPDGLKNTLTVKHVKTWMIRENWNSLKGCRFISLFIWHSQLQLAEVNI